VGRRPDHGGRRPDHGGRRRTRPTLTFGVLLGSIDHQIRTRVATRQTRPRLHVTIFTIWFQNFPNNFVILLAASAIAGTFIFIFAKSAMVAEGGRQGWVKRITGPNAKILFSILFVLWALVFGIGLQLVPHEGASSPYGGLGLIALFTGFFIIMGLTWSVIGD
jgi:hypothetical protein